MEQEGKLGQGPLVFHSAVSCRSRRSCSTATRPPHRPGFPVAHVGQDEARDAQERESWPRMRASAEFLGRAAPSRRPRANLGANFRGGRTGRKARPFGPLRGAIDGGWARKCSDRSAARKLAGGRRQRKFRAGPNSREYRENGKLSHDIHPVFNEAASCRLNFISESAIFGLFRS